MPIFSSSLVLRAPVVEKNSWTYLLFHLLFIEFNLSLARKEEVKSMMQALKRNNDLYEKFLSDSNFIDVARSWDIMVDNGLLISVTHFDK